MKKIYSQRRDQLVACLQQQFKAADIEISGSEAGLHFILWLNQIPAPSSQRLNEALQQAGITVHLIDQHYYTRPQRCGLIISFGLIELNDIERAVSQLSRVVKQLAGH